MKYSVLGFNQQAVCSLEVDYEGKILRCDLTDLMILNYILYAQSNIKMKHIVHEEISYVWLEHDHILQDLPILNLSKGGLRNRLLKLKQMDLIMSVQKGNSEARGSRTYYSITSCTNDLIYGITSFGNDLIGGLGHFQMTSNNKQLDNKVKSNLSKDKLTESKDPDPGKFLKSKQSAPKDNLYRKCLDLIHSKTQDETLNKALTDYLKVRLKNADKPLYSVKMWEALLNKLFREFSEKDRLEVVYQSLERGYASFFPVNSSYANKSNIHNLEGIPKDGRYDNEDHTRSNIVF